MPLLELKDVGARYGPIAALHGLAPLVVEEFFRVVRALNEEDGLTVLVVEQNANIALDVSSRAYVVEVGRVALEGSSDELKRHEGIRASYLGY